MYMLRTVVAEHEDGFILKYPPSLGCSLVQSPYQGHSSREKAAATSASSKRKKKSGKKKLNKGEELQRQYHAQIEERLLSCYQTLFAIGRKIQYFPVQPGNGGHHQQELSSVDFESLCSLDALIPVQDSPYPLCIERDVQEELDLFGHLICNIELTSIIVRALGKRFNIPAKSSFLLSDLCKIDLLLTHPELETSTFGLVVLDPPWENRSAIRGKKYAWISNEQLLQIPLPSLVAPRAVVAVWVTNKRSIARFVRGVLFPSWSIEYVGEWHWIKVTTNGDLVWPMDSTHKKPYETLLIGRMRTNSLPDHSLHEEPVPEVLYQKDQKTQYTTSSMDASRIPGNKISTESHTGTTQTCTELEVHVVDSLKSLSAVEYKNIIQEEDKTMLQTLVSSTNCPSILSVCAANQLEHAPQLNEPSSQTLLTSTKHDITSGLGIVDGHVDLTPQLDEPPAKKHKSDKTKECGPSLRVDLPSQLCFLAVPSCVHSQKPYLGEMLDKYVPEGCNKLELFARNLMPGWTSWGNEVLKFQVTD